MASLKSKVIIWLIRNRHLFKFKWKPEVVDENFSVEQFRADIDRSSARMTLPRGTKAEKTKIGEMIAEWIIPEGYQEGKVLLYIHGGGFISGSCHTHRMHVAKFARECSMKSLVFDYRLAPEHPFPAAAEDCLEAYQWLLKKNYRPEDIALGGESAGGTLTLSLLLLLKKKGIGLPGVAFSISPVTDLRCQADSFTFNAKKDVAPLGSWDLWTSYYIGDNDPTNPILSPLFGDYQSLPPIYICVGTHEIHLNDCENVALRARDHGVDVTLKKWDKMIHAFPLLSPLFPEAKKAMKEICDFVQSGIQTQ